MSVSETRTEKTPALRALRLAVVHTTCEDEYDLVSVALRAVLAEGVSAWPDDVPLVEVDGDLEAALVGGPGGPGAEWPGWGVLFDHLEAHPELLEVPS